METQVKLNLDLDQKCWSCEGGFPLTENEDGACGICGGKKYVATEAGDELIQFIARHWDAIEKARKSLAEAAE